MEGLNMSKIMKTSGLLIVLAAVLLSACGSGQAEPTINPDLIYTSAAMTVAAQLTEAAELNPTSTFTIMPPTETQAAPTLPINPPGTSVGGTPGQGLLTSTALVLPTFTASPLPPVAQAKYEVIGQSPADDTKIHPGTSFDMIWTIKNTGTETWTENYTVQFFTGDRIGGGHYTTAKYEFGKNIKPGETINVRVDMQAPKAKGEYYSWWKLKDANGVNFGDVDVTIIVTDSVETTSVP